MHTEFKRKSAVFAIVLLLAAVGPAQLRAEDSIENAGVGMGMTLGNAVFLPAKAISASVGLLAGAFSVLVTGGDLEVAKQLWRDTTDAPYVIGPDLAHRAVGQRPEVERK